MPRKKHSYLGRGEGAEQILIRFGGMCSTGTKRAGGLGARWARTKLIEVSTFCQRWGVRFTALGVLAAASPTGTVQK